MEMYERLKKLSADDFKRATGVKYKTFKLMLKLLYEAHQKKMSHGGRPCKLSIENQLLMILKYLRDYPTYFKLGLEFGISQSAACKICHWVENVLIKSKKFSLPGKAKLLTSQYQLILVDVG